MSKIQLIKQTISDRELTIEFVAEKIGVDYILLKDVLNESCVINVDEVIYALIAYFELWD